MNTREALLKVADHIEKNPSALDFTQCFIGGDPDTGCPLVWAARFSGLTGRLGVAASTIIGTQEGTFDFFVRMNEINADTDNPFKWIADAKVCVRSLREYADTYHPMRMAA